MRKVLVAAIAFACASIPAYATAVTGVVVDTAGNPVADAMITYTNIANRLVYVYSNQSGQFCIPAPSEWDLNNLPMYRSTCNTETQSPVSKASPSSPLCISAKGSIVYITLGPGIHSVSATIYDCSGKRIEKVLDRSLAQGIYSFSPLLNNARLIPRQLYIVRVADGSYTQTFRMLNVGSGNTGYNLKSPASNDPVSLKKVLAPLDGLRVGKTGYLPDTVQLTTYGDNVGNVRIKAINIEHRVDSLLALMTQDEKIGQLMQPAGPTGNAAQTYLLGSYLKGEGQPGQMQSALSTRLKIPLLVGNDWVHGGRHVYFPHEVGLGCMNDTLLTELAYRIYAMCCIPLYNNCCFAPCIDVHRSDFSGRVYEGFAETPELTVPLARASVRGLQGTDLSSGYTMIATLKHWAAGGGTNGGGGWADANTAPNLGVLAQIHFPPFLAAIRAGAGSVMTGYQKVFGTVMAVNKQLVTDTLKNGWGFDGFVLTDWGTSDNQQTACINAGHDLCMTVDPTTFPGIIKNAVPGTIPQTRIDDAVRRLLRAKFRLGLFENPWPNLNLNNYLSSADYRKVARQCVRKSCVLLKNENNVLPLSKTAHIFVAGNWADNMGYQCGGWSATAATFANDNTNVCATGDEGWQGSGTAHGLPGSTTILQGLQAVNPNVTYSASGANIPANTDVIVVGVGETPYAEGNGDKTDISLQASQQTLVHTLAASGKPVVTILITGRPNVLGTIPADSKALVAAWLPGTEGGGIADLLFGDYPFTGKLCVTWPASNAQEPINTGNMGDNVGTVGTPLFAYGYGLTF